MKIKSTLKIITVAIITSVLFLVEQAPVFGQDFKDVPTSSPYYQAIHELQSRGIISGYGDGTFRPDQNVSRVEALKILLLGAGLDVPNKTGTGGFSDTQGDAWYSLYLLKALDMGVIKGFPDKTFKPEQTVNLVELLKMLILSNSIDLSGLPPNEPLYGDTPANEWYLSYLQYAKDNHLIDADSANRIYPSQAVTRGKLADIIYRMIKLNGGMLPIQKLRAEQLVSIFENNTTKFQYAYSENLNDGRGITAGIAGFTTANGDGYAVVKRYTQLEPSNPLSPYLATLKQLAADESDDTSQLSGYGDAWKVAANDPVFRRVQDEIMDEDYYNPAMKHADELGLSFPLSRAVLFDSIIQHGDGEDPDGLPALIARTNAKMGGSPGTGVDEKDWLKGFLQVRMDDLTNPSDPTTKDVWAASVGRAQVLLKIADDGNYELKGPIVVNAVDYQGTTN